MRYEVAAILLGGGAYDCASSADSNAGAVVAPLNSSLRSSGRCAYACLTIVRILSGTRAAGVQADTQITPGSGPILQNHSYEAHVRQKKLTRGDTRTRVNWGKLAHCSARRLGHLHTFFVFCTHVFVVAII